VSLSGYVDRLQMRGELWFTKEQALAELGCSIQALRRAIDKLKAKKRLVVIRAKLVLIIPLEYKSWGIIPADWFIDPLMKLLEIPYYIGILSAGQFHGAAHQKPMQLQVVAGQFIKDIKHERVHIRFLYSDNIARIPTERKQVSTGYAIVATPETTALDLCRYYKACGYWSNVVTVLAELKEKIDAKKLAELANTQIYDLPTVQRLGYLLSLPEVEAENLTPELAKIVQRKNARWVPLQPGRKLIGAARDPQWRVIINTEIEIDDI